MHLDVLLKWLSGKDSTCQSACLARSCRFDLCVWKIPWRKKWQPTPVFLLGNSMDRGAWWASVHVVMTEHSCTHWDIVRQPLRLLPPNPHLLLFVPRVTLPLESNREMAGVEPLGQIILLFILCSCHVAQHFVCIYI